MKRMRLFHAGKLTCFAHTSRLKVNLLIVGQLLHRANVGNLGRCFFAKRETGSYKRIGGEATTKIFHNKLFAEPLDTLLQPGLRLSIAK